MALCRTEPSRSPPWRPSIDWRRHLCVGLCVVALETVSTASQPQSLSPFTLVVLVRDPGLLPVEHAAVTLVGPEPSSAQQSGQTNATGEVAFVSLAAGRYRIALSVAGFHHDGPTEVSISADQRLTITLKVADIVETVVVRPSVMAPFRRVLRPEDLLALPDDPKALADALRELGGPDAVLLIDGFERGLLPHKSEIREVRFRWRELSAETHASSPVTVEVITQPGSDAYRGSVSWGIHTPSLAARDPFSRQPSNASTTQLSAYIGGPIHKATTSFSLMVAHTTSVEPTPLASGTAGVTVPMAAERQSLDAIARLSHLIGQSQHLRFWLSARDERGEGLGVGALDRPERAYRSGATNVDVNASLLMAPATAMWSNELRVTLGSANYRLHPESQDPAVLVSGAMHAGGAQREGVTTNTEWKIENDSVRTFARSSMIAGASIEGSRYRSNELSNSGGTYSFASREEYEAGRPFLYTRRVGESQVADARARGAVFTQYDHAIFARASVGVGLRAETQGGVRRRPSFSPRARITWQADGNTTVKAGIGVYREWIPDPVFIEQTRSAANVNEIVIRNPDWPQLPSGQESGAQRRRYLLSEELTLPTVRRWLIGVDRRLGERGSLTLQFDENVSHSTLRSRALGNRTTPDDDRVLQIDASGYSRTRSSRVAFNHALPRRGLASINYVWRLAENETDGPFTPPTVDAAPSVDRGPSNDDIRHRVSAYTLLPLPRGLMAMVSAGLISGRPYSLRTGMDDNDDGFVNDRPVGATRNSLRASTNITSAIRLMYRRRLGETTTGNRVLQVYVDVQNVLNRANDLGFVGIVGSPLFGRPTAVGPMRRVEFGGSISLQ